MSTHTPNLSLPYIQASQAQKHVTHNEALRALDTLVQLSVRRQDLSTPPNDLVSGDRFIVATPASGDWVGQDGTIAIWNNTAWSFLTPQPGWNAWVQHTAEFVVFEGDRWQSTTPAPVTRLEQIGINTDADTTNRLAVASDTSLFTPDATGDHRMVINKTAATDTASLMFQTNWAGHAEMGLTGGDNFSIKTSPDGTAWSTTMTTDAQSGLTSFPGGISSVQFQVPFRSVYKLTPPSTGGFLFLAIVDPIYPQIPASGIFAYDVGKSPLLLPIWLGDSIESHDTRPLGGTTGTVKKVNVALKQDDSIYIENQYLTSGTRQFSATFIGGYNELPS